jgi:hypothetical protein
MDHNDPVVRLIYTLMAAVAGSVTALAFMKWKEMSNAEIALTLFVGASFALFVTPWVAHLVFGLNGADVRTISGLTYVTASGSNTLLPMLIRKVSRTFGADEGEAK